MASIEMPVPAGQPVVTSQVPTQAATNISANVTNPLINGTNQGAGGFATYHEWVWFQLEWQAGYNLGPAQTECRLIALVVHQEIGVLPLKVQQLSYQDVLIEFDSIMDVELVAQKWLRMEWWMGALSHLECIPCSNKDVFWESRGDACPLGGCRVDRPIKVGVGNPHRCFGSAPSQKLWHSLVLGGHQEWPEYNSIGGFGDPHLAIFSGSDLPLSKREATCNQ